MPVLARGEEPKKHAEMRREHAAALKEHREWDGRITRFRVEHQRALAVLSRLQAAVHEHEAALLELSHHVKSHEEHLQMHERAMAAHEQGEKVEHDKLAEVHKKLQQEHARVGQSLERFKKHHGALIGHLGKLMQAMKKAHASDAGEKTKRKSKSKPKKKP